MISALHTVLIDTWWNVNTVLHQSPVRISQVLIDTWWNVNKVVTQMYSKSSTVLIDTWWNVNRYEDSTPRNIHSGFNRYMVECECIISSSRNSSSVVLIDTWWNVNAKIVEISQAAAVVLIDTWWNVNYHQQLRQRYLKRARLF